jgi:hypothetical protein
MVGVVAHWLDGSRSMKQRFFFGHDNDIQCLTMHPNRRFVATGQQTATDGMPYTCIWDIGEYEQDDRKRLASGDEKQLHHLGQARDPVQLQRLVLPKQYRSIIGVAFSGNQYASCSDGHADRRGGELLVTISGDNQHTVHIWRWMIPAEQAKTPHDKLLLSHCRAMYIPSWYFGPEKKLPELHRSYKYFTLPEEGGPLRHIPGGLPMPIPLQGCKQYAVGAHVQYQLQRKHTILCGICSWKQTGKKMKIWLQSSKHLSRSSLVLQRKCRAWKSTPW